ncbi:MAG: 3-oxocholest-4-en-26-oate---CoA ligase, partial [Mycobacterium sp.]|nr:3-oxocholest-4-en-26-oate---CoA ligase [Mycobacterium sp.]
MDFNIAEVFSAVAAANPNRDAIVFGDRRFTFAQTDERARRFARALHSWGYGARRERPELAPHESGQTHLGLYLANCNEFLEAMIGAYKARVAPFNVNYRYVADELVYLIRNANADAIVYHARFASTLAEALAKVPRQVRLIHVDDGSGNEPLPGAVRYEELLASVSNEPLDVVPSPDDLYVLYTGGTTGMPKAVLWRQHDIYMNAMGGRTYGTGEPVTGLHEIVERSKPDGPGSMTAAPLMHGAAQWAAFINLCGGRPFVMSPTTTHFDPAELWEIASRERTVSLSIVGDAFGRPLVDELEAGDYDLSGLFILVTGGAALSAPLKQRFVELLPHLTILDAGGS